MKLPPFYLLALCAFGIGAPAACQKNAEPFYMTDIEALRRLPEEDLLRMRDDILSQAALLPEVSVADPLPQGETDAAGELRATGEGTASGTVQLRTLPGGGRVACLLDFRVPQAPDLRAEIAAGGPYLDLGALRGNAGQQIFPLPENLADQPAAQLRIRSVIFDETLAAAEVAR